ncbi:ompA family protein [Caballeronia peredens]|nr:ompA family protein [Caballeronia peredens]
MRKLASTDIGLLPVALRDTALMVSDFADTSLEKSVEDLRDRGEAQIKTLGAELEASGWSQDMIDDAQYAQCALLDEVALSGLFGEQRDDWESQPLQLIHFKTNDAGEELLRRIDKRLHDPRPVRPLLAIFGAVLDLGFTGRLALEGGNAKARLRQAIATGLGVTHSLEENDDDSIVVKTASTRSWTQRISPLAGIAFGCVAVGLAWFGVNRWLDASVARMIH